MIHIPAFVDTKDIIVNLLYEDKKSFLTINRLQELLDFIYIKLSSENKLDDYQISFHVNFDAIVRTVVYNDQIFELDIDDKTIILLKGTTDLEEDVHDSCKLDNTLLSIVREFVEVSLVV